MTDDKLFRGGSERGTSLGRDTRTVARASRRRLHFSPRVFYRSRRKSPKSAAGRTNINNGMIMNQIVREKPISYWPTGANDWSAVYLHPVSPLVALSSLSLFLDTVRARSFPRCTRSLQPTCLLPPPLRPQLSRAAHAFFRPPFFPASRFLSLLFLSSDTSAIGQHTQCIFFN